VGAGKNMNIGNKVVLVKSDAPSYQKYVGKIGVIDATIKPKDEILYSVVFFDDVLACTKEEIEDAPTENQGNDERILQQTNGGTKLKS
jgi:hypothetical protein